MKRARRELFAGSRFAADENHFRVGRQPLNQAEELLHHRAAPHHAAEFELLRHLALERDNLCAPLELHADVSEDLLETFEIERLGEVLAGAQLDRFDRAVDRGVGGHENHFAARSRGPDLPQQIEAVDVGHAQVDHRQIGGLPDERLHRIGAAAARDHIESRSGGQALYDTQHRLFVVDDEQQRTRGQFFGHGGINRYEAAMRTRSSDGRADFKHCPGTVQEPCPQLTSKTLSIGPFMPVSVR